MADPRQRAPYPNASTSPGLRELDSTGVASRVPPPSTWTPTGKGSDLQHETSYRPSSAGVPPVSFSSRLPGVAMVRFALLCTLWYASSAVSSNTGKVILNRFRFPVTLTIVQFFFVAGLCMVCTRSELGFTSRLRQPTKAIIRSTLPMAAFQVGGHIFSSLAISRVPVSTVHTIKALSPLCTVLAYAALFGVSYSAATYVSLLPLTLGVMLACSFDMTVSNIFGLVCALGSTLIFVSQNIFFKKIVPTNSETSIGPKLDKINLLYFSSGMAFLLMVPLWLYYDAYRLIVERPSPPLMYFCINGTVHFAQNLLAFAILSSTSPVTYSIASLVKRIAVICLAIVWFKQAVHPVQAVGIALTGVGLWMYNSAKRDVEKGEKKMRQVEASREGALPLSHNDERGVDRKDIHASPKPLYSADVGSTTSAIRYVALPPPLKSNGVGQAPPPPPPAPYPSPPPSAANSPPQTHLPLPKTRQRRPSHDSPGHPVFAKGGSASHDSRPVYA